MSYINSKRYGTAVQHYLKENGDVSYYVTYKDESNKLKRVKIGDKSQGINENFCHRKRNEILHKIRLGEEVPVKQRKSNLTNLNSIAEIYFTEKKSAQKRQAKYELHIKPVFGNSSITSITREDVIKFRDKRIKEKEKEGTLKSIKVPSSIEIVYVFMSSAILVPVSGLFYA